MSHEDTIQRLHQLDTGRGWEGAACVDALAALDVLLAEIQQLRKLLLRVQLTEINGRLCARPEPPDPLLDNPDAPRESKCCPACRKLWEQIDAALARVEKSE